MIVAADWVGGGLFVLAWLAAGLVCAIVLTTFRHMDQRSQQNSRSQRATGRNSKGVANQ